MENTKNIFKILIVIQLLAFTLATYGHPDAEFIDFGSPSQQPSRDQMIIEAAIKRGMDGEAVAELLRTRKPVTRTTTTPTGFTKTTTYKLEPDGSISSKSILQKRNSYVYNSGSIPDELKNSPTGTVTRTFTDSDGNKVTQTIAVNRNKSVASAVDTDDLSDAWFSKSFPSWPEDTLASPKFTTTNHRTVSRTYNSPNGGRTTVQSWSSEPEFPQAETPFTLTNNTPNFRRTNTRTFIKPNGERRLTQTTSTSPDEFDVNREPKFPSIDDINWPNFDESPYVPSWGNMNPGEDNDDGWEVIEDPEVTTKKTFKSWTPKTWEWPEFPKHPTTTITPTVQPKVQIEAEPATTRKLLPSLDDFLKRQYGAPTTSSTKTFTYTPKYETTTLPKALTSSTPRFIKIEDLPVHEVLHNGKPADENVLRNLPAYLTPRTPAEPVLKIDHKHPIEEDVESFTPKVESTNIRSYTKTLIGPEKPRLKDLDPQMQDILKNAGIVPEIEGDAVTKTRTEPDGRVITTTYKVNTVPSPPAEYEPATQHHYESNNFHSYQPNVPLQPLKPHLNPIVDFLARLGLTKFDITSRSGHYSRTFIDENGDILTATFVLTSKHPATERK